MSRYIRIENEDSTYTGEKVYTAEDMQGFAEWCNTKGWYYISGDKKWFYEFTKKDRSIGYKYKSTTQLLKMWEEQK